DLGFRDPSFMADLGKAALIRIVGQKNLSEGQRKAFEAESESHFGEAIQSQRDLGYIYSVWASARYWAGDYKDAWEKVRLARTHGGAVPGKFIQLLSAKMPEP